MDLTDIQLERYARHIMLREIGGHGQKKLLQSRVLVVGAGGIGAPVLLYLAAAGVGHLGIVDDDSVALSNLQRQVIYGTEDIGRLKAQTARTRLHALNPDVQITLHTQRLTADNATSLIAPYDLVIDGCDNFETRFAVSAACLHRAKPLLSAAIGEFDGQISLFTPDGKSLPCYRCFVPEAPAGAARCTEQGVVGAIAGLIGTWTALEAVKHLAGFGETLAGRMLLVDGLTPETRTVRLKRDPVCPHCSPDRKSHTD